MRYIEQLLTSALTALLLAGTAGAQPPGPPLGPRPGLVRPSPLSVDEVVGRIMAFDKNKDGKVTRDELPERMHHLITLGDTNKDGALDRDEIKKLVAARATAPGPFGFRTQTRVGFGRGPGLAGFAGFGPGAVEGVVDDLKLAGKKKAQALAAVKAHQENVRKLMDQARAQLLQQMKEILSAEELKDFEAALDRPRGGTIFVGPGPLDGPRPGDAGRRTDPFPRDLDPLPRQPRR